MGAATTSCRCTCEDKDDSYSSLEWIPPDDQGMQQETIKQKKLAKFTSTVNHHGRSQPPEAYSKVSHSGGDTSLDHWKASFPAVVEQQQRPHPDQQHQSKDQPRLSQQPQLVPQREHTWQQESTSDWEATFQTHTPAASSTSLSCLDSPPKPRSPVAPAVGPSFGKNAMMLELQPHPAVNEAAHDGMDPHFGEFVAVLAPTTPRPCTDGAELAITQEAQADLLSEVSILDVLLASPRPGAAAEAAAAALAAPVQATDLAPAFDVVRVCNGAEMPIAAHDVATPTIGLASHDDSAMPVVQADAVLEPSGPQLPKDTALPMPESRSVDASVPVEVVTPSASNVLAQFDLLTFGKASMSMGERVSGVHSAIRAGTASAATWKDVVGHVGLSSQDAIATEDPITGNRCLHVAAACGHLELVAFLIASGAEIDAKNAAGKTALDLSTDSEHLSVSKLFIDSRANASVLITGQKDPCSESSIRQ